MQAVPAQLPLLDIAEWRAQPESFVNKLRDACHHIGFFQLRARLPAKCAERLMQTAEVFFSLPLEQKMALDYRKNPAFRGYMALGCENTAGVVDSREQMEFAPEGGVVSHCNFAPHERLRGPNQWPCEQPQLRVAVEEFVSAMCALSHELTAAVCSALRLPPGSLDGIFGLQPHWQMKLARYPPANSADTIGVGAHTDSGFLTLLLQDDVGGLQVQHLSSGIWVDVPPLGPDVLVCNLGEVAEILSGGFLRATPHRVLSTQRPRLSIPFFFNPHLDATIKPVVLSPELVWERSAAHDEARWKRAGNELMSSYGANAFKSLARSHPEAMRLHHPDLVGTKDGLWQSRL
jgi:isopenicillin N synthase-like dioxygenase